MKLFRLLGASERQGFGGPLIYKTAIQNDLKRPEIITDIERTELKVWNIDLVDSYPDLSLDEENIFRYIVKSTTPQSINAIRSSLDLTEYRVRKCIQSLEGNNLIIKIGNSPSTKYTVGFEGVEIFTQLQLLMDMLKKTFDIIVS